MFNPFDGATFLTGTVFMSVLGIIAGNSGIAATAVGALITGFFVLAAKLVELWWKSRSDKEKVALKARAERAEADVIHLLESKQAR